VLSLTRGLVPGKVVLNERVVVDAELAAGDPQWADVVVSLRQIDGVGYGEEELAGFRTYPRVLVNGSYQVGEGALRLLLFGRCWYRAEHVRPPRSRG
jgi:hypothetical protein